MGKLTEKCKKKQNPIHSPILKPSLQSLESAWKQEWVAAMETQFSQFIEDLPRVDYWQ